MCSASNQSVFKPLAKNLNGFRQIQGSTSNLKFLFLHPIVNPVVMSTVDFDSFKCCCLFSRITQGDVDRPPRIVNCGNFDPGTVLPFSVALPGVPFFQS